MRPEIDNEIRRLQAWADGTRSEIGNLRKSLRPIPAGPDQVVADRARRGLIFAMVPLIEGECSPLLWLLIAHQRPHVKKQLFVRFREFSGVGVGHVAKSGVTSKSP
jgi:hypothetical protein